MEKLKENLGKTFGNLLGTVGGWLLSTLFIWWGWNTFAYHLNLFALGYWEVFAIRMAFSHILGIVARTFKK